MKTKQRTAKPITGSKARVTASAKGRLMIKHSPSAMKPNLTLYPNLHIPKPNSIEEKDLISEKELLIQERYQLKNSINSLNEELSKYKAENVHISLLLSQREKELEEIISANPQQKEKIIQSIVISKMKATFKEQTEELKRKEKEVLELQRSKGYCSSNELKIENEQLTQQLASLAGIYSYSTSSIANANFNDNQVQVLKGMIARQHCIIKDLDEKVKESQREVRQKKKEIEEVKQKFEVKNVAIQKLENDNKKLNGFIKRSLRNEVGDTEWQNEKRDYAKKIKELEDNVEHYKSLYVNKKEIQVENQTAKEIKPQIRPVIKSVNNFDKGHPEESTDKQILLLKSIISELRNENKELKATIQLYQNSNIIASDRQTDRKKASLNDNLTPSSSIELSFEDILLINLSAKSINSTNAKQFFSSIVNEESINEMSQSDLLTSIANALALILDCSSNQKDKDALFLFFKEMASSDDIDNFSSNFFAFFTKVNAYEDAHLHDALTQDVKKELSKQPDLISSLLSNFPQTITMPNLVSILKKNGVSLSKEMMVFLCYEMKSASILESLGSKGGSMMNLKTAKLNDFIQLKMLEEGLKYSSDKSKNEEEKEDRSKNEAKEDKDDEFEASMEMEKEIEPFS